MSIKQIYFSLIMFLLIVSCQEMPDRLPYDNPVDPENPVTCGDPFRLHASLKNGEVTLIWSEVEMDIIVGYHIYRSQNDFETSNLVATTSKGNPTYIDTSVYNGQSYWYKVTAYDKNGDESSQTNVVSARIDTEPVILINDDALFAFEITVSLTILAPAASEMWISNYPDFRDGHWESYQTTRKWDLLSTEGIQTVYVKFNYDDGSISSIFHDTIFLDLTSPPMIYIPAGEFTMGSDENVGDSDEHPKHTVYLDGFWIDKYEVTNEQYAKFLSDGNESYYQAAMKIVNSGNGIFQAEAGYESHPVIYVNHVNALAYARWRGGSLPTEAQWEKAARSHDLRTYPWGNIIESSRANYWNSDDLFEKNSPPRTTPVGYYDGSSWNGYQTKDSPSAFGLYDLSGNVWEWCIDWYQFDYYHVSPLSNPTGPATGTNKVIRGGSWVDDPYYLRTACRSHLHPHSTLNNVGFRIVKTEWEN